MRRTPLKVASLCLLLAALWINSLFAINSYSGTYPALSQFRHLFIVNEGLILTAIALLTVALIRRSYTSLQYKRLFDDHPIPMWIYDKETLHFLSVNNAAVEKYGYSRQEFKHMTLFDIREETEYNFLMDNIRERCNGVEYRGLWRHRKKDGTNFFVELYAHSVMYQGREGRFIMAKDVDAQVRAAREATELGERYELLSQATNDAVYDRNLITDTVAWNHGLQSLFQYNGHENTDMLQWWKANIHPSDKKRVLHSMEEAIRSGSKHWSEEYRFQCATGQYKYVVDRAYIMYDNEHKVPVRMIGMMQDIDKRIEQTRQLEEQNQALKEIAWINSHEIRRPVASILSITELFDRTNADLGLNLQLLDWLYQSTQQLDEVIHKIEYKAREIR
ncbi:PAS domain-containing protein [Chitinophaga vietnamensis]|uniref:PAS domain-containing protein n=1 Tax=Chitinophaga vietnamensis TaxID=2593957 RepID=UPI001178657D|nr:PAS domain-containing protein [Chitinophaga vietnamensis]